MISFFPTTKCNLRCVYCYNSKERAEIGEHSLDIEEAEAAINEYFKDECGSFNIELKEPHKRHIRFYGPGEATEAEGFLLMEQIVILSKRKAKVAGYELITELQTNGAFNNEVREWILDNINLLWISFDGTPDIHNKQRPMLDYIDENGDDKTKDSSDIIEENIKLLLEKKDNRILEMVGLRSTITKDSVYHQKEMIDHYEKLGIKYIWCDPEFPAVDKEPVKKDTEKYAKYDFDLEAYVEQYIKAYQYAKTKGIFYGSFLTCNFDAETTLNCRCCLPVPHITPDGYVSACDLVVLGEKANHMQYFIYGKWDKENGIFVNFEKEKKALKDRNVDNIEKFPVCQKCKVKLHCAGYCPGEVVNETGDLYERLHEGKRNVCKAINKLYDELYDEIKKDLGKEKDGLYPYPHP